MLVLCWLLKESGQPVCCALVHNIDKMKKGRTAMVVISPLKCSAMLLNVRLPPLIDYVAFYQTVPVPHHYPEEGTL